MTYPDDVLKAAQEIALSENWANSAPAHFNASQARMYIAKVAAARAITAERQRCAGIAQSHLDRLPTYSASGENVLLDKVEEGYGNAALNIKAAILGQQETGNDRA